MVSLTVKFKILKFMIKYIVAVLILFSVLCNIGRYDLVFIMDDKH